MRRSLVEGGDVASLQPFGRSWYLSSRRRATSRSERAEIAQSVEHATENRGVASSILALGTKDDWRSFRAEVAQLVEHHLAKVRVAGSSPVFRSIPFMLSMRTVARER